MLHKTKEERNFDRFLNIPFGNLWRRTAEHSTVAVYFGVGRFDRHLIQK